MSRCWWAALCLLALAPLPASAVHPALVLRETPAGLWLSWHPTAGTASPQTLAVTLPEGADPTPQIESLLADRATAGPTTIAAPVPQTADGSPRPALAQAAIPPAAPLSLLRESRIAGVRVAVFGLRAQFVRAGVPLQLRALQALIPHAQSYAGAPLRSSSRLRTLPPSPSPLAEHPAIILSVAAAGLQQVSGATLAAAGLDLAALDPATLRLWRAGAEVPLEIRSATAQLGPSDTLRFYAPAPGDRWNAVDRYWLTSGGVGQRMASRSVTPGLAPARTTGLEHGLLRLPLLYDSTLPGPDGDHWFAADLRAGPGLPPAALSLPLTPTLPLASGTLSLTLEGAAYTSGAHTIAIASGTSTAQRAWSGVGNWTQTVALAQNTAQISLTLMPGAAADGVELDALRWERPVTLALGGRGALFGGLPGIWRYALSGLGADQELYDISDPQAPQRLTGWADGVFQDGPSPRRYLISGPETLRAPPALGYTPFPLPSAADALYLAPADLLPALGPLLAHRRAHGYQAVAVDLQAIYDRWSFGQVDPEAIRSFLRAAAIWTTPPQAVTLVGDGTSDPRDYTGHHQRNLLPPYLAMVDPWIGETACDACYAQLDGASPLDDALPDVAIGRLPVADAASLAALVTKIIAYETDPNGIDWRSRQIYLADNGYAVDGTPDGAGDFATMAEQIAALQPPGVAISRVYYDPRPASGLPGHEPNAAAARAHTLALLDQGAGVVVYVGHGHQWQWAVTDPQAAQGYLLTLYDTDGLKNQGRPAIVLSLTCLSGAFQTPSFSGTTLDERWLRAPGGAVAVWGSTGLGVAHGHDALARGFFRALWRAPAQHATLGALNLAGMRELFTSEICCQDALRTFVLLGDPLTPARVLPAERLALPFVMR